MQDPNGHPLLTKRMGGAFAILAGCTGVGLTVMTFSLLSLRLIGMGLSLLGACAAISIYRNEIRCLRLRLLGNDGSTKPLHAELWIVLIAITISVLLPAYVWYIEAFPAVHIESASHLTSDQKDRMEMALKLTSTEQYSFQINSVPSCDECERFAEELRDFLNTIPGWTISGGPLIFSDGHWRRGLLLSTRDDERHTAPVEHVRRAFDSAGIKLETESEEFKKGTFVIIVGRAT